MDNKTRITLAESSLFYLQHLAKLIEKHASNATKMKIQLCFEDGTHTTAEDNLLSLCADLYAALCSARKCVENCAEWEHKHNENSIYYDLRKGHNGGAIDLLKDVDELLEKYHERLVEIDLIK